MKILFNLLEILIYGSIGLFFSFLGYKLTEALFHKSFDLNKELDNHNISIGIMISGMFIAIGIIMSGVL